MSSVLLSIQTTLELNTRLFRNCLSDVSEEVAARVVAKGTNSMIFIAVHLFDARIFMAQIAGTVLSHPYPEVAAAQRVQDIPAYPSLGDLIVQWNHVSTALAGCLELLSDAQLQAPSSRRFPVKDKSLLGALSFLIQHESYHVGQLSLLRRINGLSAMRYTESA